MGSTRVPPCSCRSCLSSRRFRGLCIFWIYETAFTSLVSLTGWFVHFLQGVVEPCLTSDGDDTFKSQANRKPVCDFIRILLMDSLLNVSANTNTHPFSLLLEVKALTHNFSQLFTVVCHFKDHAQISTYRQHIHSIINNMHSHWKNALNCTIILQNSYFSRRCHSLLSY